MANCVARKLRCGGHQSVLRRLAGGRLHCSSRRCARVLTLRCAELGGMHVSERDARPRLVLDLGCGSGLSILPLEQRLPPLVCSDSISPLKCSRRPSARAQSCWCRPTSLSRSRCGPASAMRSSPSPPSNFSASPRVAPRQSNDSARSSQRFLAYLPHRLLLPTPRPARRWRAIATA